MKTRKITAWASACYLVIWHPMVSDARLWTDTQGRTIEGELESATTKDVTVVLKSGKKVVIPLARLSQGDRFYVDVMREEMAKGTPPPGGMDTKPAEKPAETPDPVAPPAAAKGPLVFPETLRYEGETMVKTLDDPEGRNAYASEHIRFYSESELKEDGLEELVRLLESARMYWKLLGLPTSGNDADAPSEVFLFDTEESYVKNGGSPGSVGIYKGATEFILVSLQNAEIKARGGRLKGGKTLFTSVMIHEMTHQLTPRQYKRFLDEDSIWLMEGLAEYLCSTPYDGKKGFSLANRLEIIARAVSESGENNGIVCRGHGKSVKLPKLAEFINVDSRLFEGGENDEFGKRSNLCYSLSFIMVTHFLHTDRGGDMTRFRNFLGALLSGATKEEAVEVLLDGDSWERIEEEMAAGFQKAGLKLKFGGLTMEEFSSLK